MSTAEALAAVVLALGISVVTLCCLALLVVRDAFARLHCASLASIVGPIAVAIAAGMQDPFGPLGFRALLFAAASICAAAVTTHALGRALKIREPEEERR